MTCRGGSWLGLGLVAFAFGCNPQGMLPLVPNSGTDMSASAEAGKDDNLPKRQPHPSTCVTLGNNSEREANSPGKSPAEQEQLREQARLAYQQALNIDPSYLQASLSLARLYETMGDHGRAVATYQNALKAHPREASVYHELGLCHARQKEWEPALGNLGRAHQLDPENRQYANSLGFCLARAGRYDDSLALFRETLGEAKAHFELARMLHHLGQDDVCRQQLRIALQVDPGLTPAQQMLGELNGPSAGSQALAPAANQASAPLR